MINKPLFWILFNVSVFLAVYLYGRKWHPQLALALSISGCVVMTLLAWFDTSWILGSVVLSLVFLFFLRMPDQRPGFRKLYAAYKINSSKKALPGVLSVLGDKNWKYSESFFIDKSGAIVPYYLWQGYTKSLVSSGEYVRTTTYSHYIAFIFPPHAVSEAFKIEVTAAADRSHYSPFQRLKFQVSPDTETPDLVTTAPDGSFIVQYYTLPESACLERRLRWMKEHLGEMRKLSDIPPQALN